MPLPPTAIPTRSALAALRTDGERQPVSQRPGPRLQRLEVRERAAAGQRPLIMRGFGDGTRPPSRRIGCQRPLAHRPRLSVVPKTDTTARLQIARGQRAQMRTHSPQHLHIGGGELLEPGTDRHSRRTRHDERLRNLRHSTAPSRPVARRPHQTQRTDLAWVTHAASEPLSRSEMKAQPRLDPHTSRAPLRGYASRLLRRHPYLIKAKHDFGGERPARTSRPPTPTPSP